MLIPANTKQFVISATLSLLMACGGGGGGGGSTPNNPPLAEVINLSVNEDIDSLLVTLTADDSDGTVNTFALTTLPASGELYVDESLSEKLSLGSSYDASANTLDVFFVPQQDFHGSANFEYIAIDDKELSSEAASANITVLNVNDAPSITNNQLSISEGQSIVISPAEIQASDVDNLNDELTLTVTQIDNAQFEHTSQPGSSITEFTQADIENNVIRFVHNGSEAAPTYTLTVSDNEMTSAGSTATINYTPINDNPPQITSAASTSLSENVTTVQSLTATDTDQDTLTFSLISGGADNALFKIENNILQFISPPDFENPQDADINNVYALKVGVSDGLNTTPQDITVSISNLNDNLPTISSPATVSIDENTINVQTIIATDGDNDTLTYNIVAGGDAGLFKFTNNILEFISAPDFETPQDTDSNNVYSVNISVSDGQNNATQSLQISINNINDNTPVFSSPVTFNVQENSLLVDTLTASDNDNDTLNYTLTSGAGDDDNALFIINNSTGELSFISSPNFEVPADANADNAYKLLAGVSDGSNSSTVALTVSVTNSNDNLPIFTNSATISHVQDTTTVTTVNATDADNDTLSYSLETGSGGEDNTLFTIDSASGLLSFIAAPDSSTPTDANTDNNYQVLVSAYDGSNRVTQAMTISVTAIPLPFSESFDSGSDGWVIVDDYDYTSAWLVSGGSFIQDVDHGNRAVVNSLDETFHRGTYAYLSTALEMSNYRVSADLTPQAQPTYSIYDDGHDIGLMFRYQDNNNYYRIVFNTQFGYTRLDRKVGGVFNTLAADARGYANEGVTINVEVEVLGELIQVYIDGEARFAVRDSSISSGTIALYTEDNASFDNILIQENSTNPSIVIDEPAAFTARNSLTFTASAVTLNLPTDATVEFEIDGTACTPAIQTAPGYFSSTCTATLPGNHSITASIRDGLIISQDFNANVASSAEVRLGLGDSLTNGVSDTVSSDNKSADGKIIGEQGYVAVLHDLLNASRATPQIIYNEAVPGDKSSDLLTRVFSILARHPEANIAQITIGTNDTGGSMPIPSGLGCSGTACNGTYKENVQNLIDQLVGAGITPIISQLPPAFKSDTPLTEARNMNIQEYNTVLRTELSIPANGPDFFTYFLSASENRLSLFEDTLHYNGLGYNIVAHLWEHYINGGTSLPTRSQLPLVLEDICVASTTDSCDNPLTYKQDLMQIGNPYYIDETHSVLSIPAILQGGIWVRPANANASNSRNDHISFTVDRNVDVYIAYDASASSRPDWMGDFADTGEIISVSNTAAPSLKVYKKSYTFGVDTPPDGTIQLGGNLASGALGANANYTIILKQQ